MAKLENDTGDPAAGSSFNGAHNKQTSSPSTIWLTGKWIIILAIGILGIMYGLFFYFQNIAQNDFRESLFEQQKDRQIASSKAIAQHIESDLDVISSKLQLIALAYANGEQLETSDKSFNQEMKVKMQRVLDELNSPNQAPLSISDTDRNLEYPPIIDALYIVDKSGTVNLDTRSDGKQNIEGIDISSRQYFIDTKETLSSQYSNGYVGSDNILRIAATFPIIDDTLPANERFEGMVVATMPTSQFFRHYGNIYDVKSQYMAVLDRNSVHLVHPVQSFVGAPFFGEHTQETTGRNEVLNSLITQVMSGIPDYAIYEFVNGERFTSGYPIYFDGKAVYFVFIITPTSTIYTTINEVLNSQQALTFIVLLASAAAVVSLIFLVTKWNSSLNREVEDRTVQIASSNQQLQRVISQLQESNRQTSFANERLIAMNEKLINSERVQKEFINVAAHELRTPIQPIIGLTEIIRNKTEQPELREMMDTIARSAERLQHLSSDILDVTKIESQTLRLNPKPVDIIDLISNMIRDFSLRHPDNNHGGNGNGNGSAKTMNGHLEILFVKPNVDQKIIVSCDKDRIVQVVSNLLDNAYKFNGEGNITVTIEKSALGSANNIEAMSTPLGDTNNGGQESALLIKIQDSGRGIEPDVYPKLFTKFFTKSEKGTGLGLFISKGIVEAHGGKIWAVNNPSSKGATFCFTLPLELRNHRKELLA